MVDVDNLTRTLLFGTTRALLATLFMAPFFAMSAFAEDLNWAFTEHPQPDSTDLPKKERALTENAKNGKVELRAFCDEILPAEFGNYNARYPAFKKTGTEHLRYSAWKTYIVASANMPAAYCVVSDVTIKLIRSTPQNLKSSIAFCGIYSRHPETPQEKQFADLMDELSGYAELGSPVAISGLLSLNGTIPSISLNTDVEYFLRKSLEQNGVHESGWSSDELKPMFNAERINFLNAAVENHNLKAVLKSTSACTQLPLESSSTFSLRAPRHN